MSEIKTGDRVVLSTGVRKGGPDHPEWDLPTAVAGTVLDILPGDARDSGWSAGIALLQWDDARYNPPCGFTPLPASWLVPVEDEIPAGWLDGEAGP